jgi:hypothetical protein
MEEEIRKGYQPTKVVPGNGDGPPSGEGHLIDRVLLIPPTLQVRLTLDPCGCDEPLCEHQSAVTGYSACDLYGDTQAFGKSLCWICYRYAVTANRRASAP